MNFHSPFQLSKRLNATALAAMAAALFAQAALACGPWFPNTYYDVPTSQFLVAPEASFYNELIRLLPANTLRPEMRRDDSEKRRAKTLERDLAELTDVLNAEKRPDTAVAALVKAYGEARRTADETYYSYEGAAPRKPVVMPDGLPSEFALYFRGVIAWKNNDVEGARKAWNELLALPEAERKHRSTWAAFMIGRSYSAQLDEAKWDETKSLSTEMLKWFRLTAELASKGFADSLDLAKELNGWEARAHLASGETNEAVKLYFKQLSTGDSSAVLSLRKTAAKVASGTYPNSGFEESVRDPLTRAVVVAYLLAQGGTVYDHMDDGATSEDSRWSRSARYWAIAIRESGQTGVSGADRLAWLAYEGGLFQLSKDWLAVAGEGSAEANWLRAKLAMRDGKLEDAARALEFARDTGKLSVEHRAQVCAELGRVRLAQDKPEAALGAWLEGAHWEDAAFVAERLMTFDEVGRAADAMAGKEMIRHGNRSDLDNRLYERDVAKALRELFARRLVRAGDFTKAAPYFSAETRALYDAYLTDVKSGFDNARPAEERAAAFWRAAQAVNAHGMEFMGTELDPDWKIWDGNYSEVPVRTVREGVPALEGGQFAPTSDEAARLAAIKVPQRRYHYKWRAVELAGWAAALMPNDNEETAKVLATAGGWVKAKDPATEKIFYQLLVIRCGNTKLGRVAAAKRWFPDADEPKAETALLTGESASAPTPKNSSTSAPANPAVNPDAKQ